MSKLVRTHITFGDVKLDNTLLVLDDMKLSTFLLSLEYMGLLLDSEMQMRIQLRVNELKEWIALFRKPYNTPKAVKVCIRHSYKKPFDPKIFFQLY